jgi:ABC-type nitrate/sulfonate/bicarbonate transport system permease component
MAEATKSKGITFAANGGRARLLRKLTVPISLFILWVVVSQLQLIRPLFLPSPQDMWQTWLNLYELLPEAILTTVTMTLTGFAIGTALGTMLGLMMAYSRSVREFLGVVFDFLRPVPVFALIPLFILWFGIGRAPQILDCDGHRWCWGDYIGSNPQCTADLRAGCAHAGGSRQHIYRTIILPTSFPTWSARYGLRQPLPGLDVAAEFMEFSTGIGLSDYPPANLSPYFWHHFAGDRLQHPGRDYRYRHRPNRGSRDALDRAPGGCRRGRIHRGFGINPKA